jgi:peptide/nickel transport system substrate-binding protein
MLRTFQRALGAAILSLVLGASAHAADLTIGLSTPVTSLDPHFHNLTPNNSLGRHVFETLVRQDESQRMQPGPAESWKALNDLEWEIKLRKGVKFHNGQNFTADDVIATFKRVPNVPNSPASFAFFVRPIVEMQGRRSADAAAEDRQAASAAAERHGRRDDPAEVGGRDGEDRGLQLRQGDDRDRTVPTGRVRAGDRVVLKRNDAYYGQKPAWDNVRFKMIPSAPARVAALLAGDVQMIEGVPTADIPKLSKDNRVAVSSAVSNRIIYLHMDSGREKNSPFVTTADGKPMEANPLRDPRVRRAISKMIDRDAIVSRIMEGQGVAAGQLLPEQFFGTSKTLKPRSTTPRARRSCWPRRAIPTALA